MQPSVIKERSNLEKITAFPSISSEPGRSIF